MTKRYTGGVVSSSLPTVNAAGASGVFLLSQQADYQSRNAWPPYKIEESLRFRSAASAYLRRTPTVSGNRTTWTMSMWVKLGRTGTAAAGYIFDGGSSTNTFSIINTTALSFSNYTSGPTYDWELISSAAYRDPAAWYHIVYVCDTTQATASNRVKVFVNGQQITAWSTATYPSQNFQSGWNFTQYHNFGAVSGGSTSFDGYMSEVNFIDGQALTPSSFGATDKDGNWSPIAYTGTYGTNGFYVNFRDNTSATTMGYDYSGNGNNWTLSGFNVSTANTTYDIMIDVPEDQAGANNRGNYAVLNPLDPKNGTQSNANLTHAMGSNDYASARSTIGMKGGKWYWEAKCETTLQSNFYMGIGITADGDYSGYNYIGSTSGGYSYDGRATKLNNNSSTSYGASYTLNDIIGVALDLDNGTIEYYKNGASQGVAFTGIDITRTYYAAHWIYTTQISYNFGQQPFTYTPPTGFKALNTFNLPEPTIKQPNKQFDVVTYTGDGTTSKTISGLNFQPDMVWEKSRSQSYRHNLYDAVRGFGQHLQPSFTDAENTVGTTVGTSFFLGATSTGFTVGVPTSGTYSGNLGTNENGTTYVGWAWNAGGSTVTNTSGSISSQVRANQTAGFSVVTYTGPGSGGGTVGHGLGVAPSMIIVKNRSAAESWRVGHSFMNGGSSPWNYYMNLNATAAQVASSSVWNNTAPTSSVFTIANDSAVSGSGNSLVAYCFAPIAGYSAFGSYTGNGSTLNDGPFVHTGFRPRFIMGKRADSTGGWWMFDTARSTFNLTDDYFYAQLSDAEFVDITTLNIDVLSNGFKVRSGSSPSTWINASGGTYIYMAFAEMPFKYARAR